MTLAPSTGLVARADRVRRALADRQIDALLVTHRPNVFYLTNFSSSAGMLLVTPRQLYVFADSRYTTALDELLSSPFGPAGAEAVRVGGSGSYDTVLADWLLENARGWKVGFEAGNVSVRRHEWLVRRLTGDGAAASPTPVELVVTDDIVERRRETKDEHETGLLREAARRLSRVATDLLAEPPRAGTTERALAADIDHRMRLAGFDRPAFDTIVASGPNSALPHAEPGDRALAPGDLVILDFGGVYGGYCVDLTRTVAIAPVDDDVRRLYRAVAAAQDAALAALRPGIAADVVDAAARDVLARQGLAEAFGHGTGHGLGLEIHEAPRIAMRRPEDPDPPVLQPGMVVTIEPGVYLPGRGGIRLEDDALVTATGAERLTDVPREGRLL